MHIAILRRIFFTLINKYVFEKEGPEKTNDLKEKNFGCEGKKNLFFNVKEY